MRNLSLDPYLRGRMNEGEDIYATPFALGAPVGGGTVAEVVGSGDAAFRTGELVLAEGGWQDYAAVDAAGLRKLAPGWSARPRRSASWG